MFDLFRSRAKAVRYGLGALLMLVALSMVVTLIPGFGTSGRTDQQVVAEVGKDAITAREVHRQLQVAMRNRQIPREMAAVYVPQFIEQMITESAMRYEAERLGFRVTDTDLAHALRMALPQLFQGGQYAGDDVLAAFLRQQELTVPEFEASVRKQLLISRLQNLVAEGVVVTPAEIDQEYRRRNEKVKLEYLAVTPDHYKSEAQVSPEEVQKRFQASRAAYQIPEKRSIQVLIVDEPTVAKRISLPEAELRKAYDANKEQYRVPERVKVRHILVKTTEKPPAEVPKLEAKAQDLLKQIKAGGDFAELAKKNSEDTGSAVKGGDLGWVVRGQTVPEFEKEAFSLKPKELSGVIKTQYGFHILQVMEKEEARLKPFEEVRAEIEQERKRQQVFDTMQKLADEAHDALAKTPGQAEDVARRLDIRLVSVDKAGAMDPLPEIGVNRELGETIAGLAKNGVTPVAQVAENKLAVAAVREVFPSRPAELAEVESQIRSQLAAQKLAQVVDQRAREALAKANAAGGDLQKVAKEMGLEVKTTQEFSVDGAADGIGSAALLGEAFAKPVGTVFGPVAPGESRFICKVIAKVPPDMSKLAEQREPIRQDIRTRKARERMDLFHDSLRTSLARDGKIKINKNVVDQIVASYRG